LIIDASVDEEQALEEQEAGKADQQEETVQQAPPIQHHAHPGIILNLMSKKKK